MFRFDQASSRRAPLPPSASEVSRPLLRAAGAPETGVPAREEKRAPRFWPGFLFGALMLAAAAGLFHHTWMEVQDGGRAVVAERRARAERFLAAEALPLLEDANAKDREAAARAIRALDDLFRGYAGGVDAFARDLTGWGTRFKLVWRKGVETVKRGEVPENAAALVREKFHHHVVSDARLEADVTAVLRQFAYDLEANRNELLGGLRVRLRTSELPVEVQSETLEAFHRRVDGELKKLLEDLPRSTVAVGVGSLTSGLVAEEAVRQMVRGVVAQAAARMTGGALAGGGAAATGAAAGGAGGSAVAPGVGTAAGIVGGFLVGAAVDWWMTDRFEEQVKSRCLAFLESSHAALITGPGGLEEMLNLQVEQTASARRLAVTRAAADGGAL